MKLEAKKDRYGSNTYYVGQLQIGSMHSNSIYRKEYIVSCFLGNNLKDKIFKTEEEGKEHLIEMCKYVRNLLT